MRCFRLCAASVTICIATTFATDSLNAADPPSAKLALSFRPVYGPVDYEIPEAAEQDKCEVKIERTGKTSGWIVLGPSGQLLRRFIDTNGDNVVDQWRYYQHGLEVYRDIDSNYNNKPDQARWLNSGGTRWGVDKNEDKRIDEWKILSAEEASRVAVDAIVSRDARMLAPLLIDATDVRTLGIVKEEADKLLKSVASPAEKLKDALAKSKSIKSSTQWMRFDSSGPGLIPADQGKADKDIIVYENAMAIVETDGETTLLQLGELVRVGEVWKLTQIPESLEGNTVQITAGGILMQPSMPGAPADGVAPGSITPEVQKLLEDLQKLDNDSPAPTAGSQALARYNTQRANILAKLVEASSSDEEREQWTRQMVDGIAAAVQTGAFDNGIKRLEQIEESVAKKDPKSDMVSYVMYRRLLAQYTNDLQTADNDKRQKVQEWWLGQLEQFAKDYPKAEDTPDAILQLAIAEEFGGNTEAARKWYDQLAKNYGSSDAAARGAGALRRLEIEGKQFTLSASNLKGGTINVQSLRGKAVLVLFWSTWCKPCTEDLPQIRALYEQYHDRGFEIVGVNLDSDESLIEPFLRQHRVTWPQIFEPGGLESEPAREYGIISLPTMFLIDRSGKVVSRGVSVEDLKNLLPDMLKK